MLCVWYDREFSLHLSKIGGIFLSLKDELHCNAEEHKQGAFSMQYWTGDVILTYLSVVQHTKRKNTEQKLKSFHIYAKQNNLISNWKYLCTLQEIFTVSFQHSADLTNSSFGIRKKLELNSIQKIKWSVGKFWRMLKTCLTNC